jgi:hypothetical protein
MKYHFIGWLQERNHDKVWAAIRIREGTDHEYFAFDSASEYLPHQYLYVWGRRGKRLKFNIKEHSAHDVEASIRGKLNKGYAEIEPHLLSQVYPEFEQDLMLITAEAKLST